MDCKIAATSERESQADNEFQCAEDCDLLASPQVFANIFFGCYCLAAISWQYFLAATWQLFPFSYSQISIFAAVILHKFLATIGWQLFPRVAAERAADKACCSSIPHRTSKCYISNQYIKTKRRPYCLPRRGTPQEC